AAQRYDAFDRIFVEQILPHARNGNLDAIKFNEALRHADSFQNPKAYIARLKRNPLVKAQPFLGYCIDCFYLERDASWQGVIVARVTDNPYGLTDLAQGETAYQPESFLPQYHQDMSDTSSALE